MTFLVGFHYEKLYFKRKPIEEKFMKKLKGIFSRMIRPMVRLGVAVFFILNQAVPMVHAASANMKMNYQGFLYDDGSGLPFNGTKGFRFRVRNGDSGPVQWESNCTDVAVSSGAVRAVLGLTNAVGNWDSIAWSNIDAHLEVMIGDAATCANSVSLTPQERVLASAYSLSGTGTGDTIWSLNGTSAHYIDGNVGIGTANPAQKLDVAGIINAQGLTVNGTGAGIRLVSDQVQNMDPLNFIDFSRQYGGSMRLRYKAGPLGGDGSLWISNIEGNTDIFGVDYSGRTRINYGLDMSGGLKMTGGNGINFTNGASSVDAIWMTAPAYAAAPNQLTLRGLNGVRIISDAYQNLMTVTNAGNRGVGTTNPAQKLDVAGTVNAQNYLLNGQPLSSGTSSQWADGANGTISYSGGNVGVGTTSPAQKLDVAGTVNA